MFVCHFQPLIFLCESHTMSLLSTMDKFHFMDHVGDRNYFFIAPTPGPSPTVHITLKENAHERYANDSIPC